MGRSPHRTAPVTLRRLNPHRDDHGAASQAHACCEWSSTRSTSRVIAVAGTTDLGPLLLVDHLPTPWLGSGPDPSLTVVDQKGRAFGLGMPKRGQIAILTLLYIVLAGTGVACGEGSTIATAAPITTLGPGKVLRDIGSTKERTMLRPVVRKRPLVAASLALAVSGNGAPVSLWVAKRRWSSNRACVSRGSSDLDQGEW